MKLTYLSWDSEFFRCKVGKIHCNSKTLSLLPTIITQAKSLNFHLIYVFSEIPLTAEAIKNEQIQLTDKKVTYLKLVSKTEPDKHIVSVSDKIADVDRNQLIELAYESGRYSRFRIDRKISEVQFKHLYKLWIEKSLRRQNAEDVLVYKKEELIAEMITMGLKNERGDIGLVAVDYKYRGRGIGSKLISAVEHAFFNRQVRWLQVVTQADNIPACKLYESYGFSLEKMEYVYHLWF